MAPEVEAWFAELSLQQMTALEKKYGYYGHDMGTSEDEWEYIYKREMASNADAYKSVEIPEPIKLALVGKTYYIPMTSE